MKKMRIIVTGLLALAVALTGCSLFAPDETELTAPASTLDPGTAVFTTFVSLGNSLTAGYQSGALYESAQINGYAALLAAAMGTGFELPLIEAPGFYGQGLPAGHLTFSFDDEGGAVIAPVPWPGGPGDPPELLNAALMAPYHNLGVPGALTVDLLQAYDAATSAAGDNDYFDMILRNGEIDWSQLNPLYAENLTALEQALFLAPTFVTLWIGNNEILGAATVGSGTPLVDPATFGFLYDQLVSGLVTAAPAAGIVIANIPPVTAAPFFNRVDWFVVDADENPVDADPETEGIQFIGLIADDGGADFQLEAGDLVTIKILSYDADVNGTPDLNEGMGIPDAVLIGGLMAQGMSEEEAIAALPVAFPHHGEPIPGTLTLNIAEWTELSAATTAFNDIIAAEAAEHAIPVVDIHTRFAAAATEGYDLGGVHYTAEFVTGGIFSLDGVHPARAGYAIVASWFAEVINENWGSNLEIASFPEIQERGEGRLIGLPRFPQGVPNLP